MIHCTKYGVWTLFVLFLASCINNPNYRDYKLENVKDLNIINVLDSLSSIEYSSFYSKISTKYSDSSQKVSFKTSVRINRDSIINTLITFMHIPVINSIISEDSIKLTVKEKKCYLEESLSSLRDRFGLEFSYSNIEELLVGIPVRFDKSKSYYRVVDPYNCTLSSHSRREIKKMKKSSDFDIITYYTLTDDLKQLKEIVIQSLQDSIFMKLDYKSYKVVDKYVVPYEVNINIVSPSNSIFIELEYKKIRFNQPELIYFTIPEGYEQCK